MQRVITLLLALLLASAWKARGTEPRASAASWVPAARADSLFRAKDWAGAARAYSAITAGDTADGHAWYRLGVARHSLGDGAQAAAAFQQAARLGFAPQLSLYNLSCSYAVMGDRDRAFATLDHLLDLGFSQMKSLEGDPELTPLRSDPRFVPLLARAQRNANPCAYSAESRQFDFWVGEWEVQDSRRDHQPVGTSSIQLVLGDCVLLENWTGLGGGSGKSFNIYSRDTGEWQQSWVDDHGEVIDFFGGEFKHGALQFHADTRTTDGTRVLRRLTFFDLGPEQVRQFSEGSKDGGKTWTVEYDFLYVRRAGSPPRRG